MYYVNTLHLPLSKHYQYYVLTSDCSRNEKRLHRVDGDAVKIPLTGGCRVVVADERVL